MSRQAPAPGPRPIAFARPARALRCFALMKGFTMNHTLSTTLLVTTLLLLPVTGHAANDGKATEYVKDSVITTKIKGELAAEKMSSLLRINVDTDHTGAVRLSGTTTTKAGAERAEAIAKGVTGVTSVKNEIKVVADK
jgi:hyperosmotically inducible periplasmic protein